MATTTQVGDLARNVAGDRAQVEQILAPNSDPHEYEPRPSDAVALAHADVILRSGGDLDEWLDQVADASGTDTPVTSLIDDVATRRSDQGDIDPHWWQNPKNAELAVSAIRDAFSSADPDGAAEYRQNAARYVSEIQDVDGQIEACMAAIPSSERKLVTSHDSLGYFADRYGIEIIGAAIPALSTQAQPSAGDTADLIAVIRAAGVPTVFPESGVSEGLEEAIASEAGASVGGELWADSLGSAGSSGATYLESLASNAEELADGLSGGSEACQVRVPSSPDSSP